MNEHSDAITRRSDELDARLEDIPLDEAVARLIEAGKREKFLMRVAIAGLIFDIIFSAVVYTNLRQAQTNRAAILNGCHIDNNSRDREQVIFDRMLAAALRTEEDLTPEKFKEIISFQQFIDEVTEPVDCEELGAGKNGMIPPSIPPTPPAIAPTAAPS